MKLSLFSLVAAALAPSAIAADLPWEGLLPRPASPDSRATPAQRARFRQDYPAEPRPQVPQPLQHHPYQYPHPQPQVPHPQPHYQHPPQHPPQPYQHPPPQHHPQPYQHLPPQHHPPPRQADHQHPPNQGPQALPPPRSTRSRPAHLRPPRRRTSRIPNPEAGHLWYGREHARQVFRGAIELNGQSIDYAQKKIEQYQHQKDPDGVQDWVDLKRDRTNDQTWLSDQYRSFATYGHRKHFGDKMVTALHYQGHASWTLGKT